MRTGCVRTRYLLALYLALHTTGGVLAGEYIRWEAEGDMIREPLTANAGDPVNGKRLVTDRNKANCLACHTMPIEDESFQGNIGPPLAGVGARLNTAQLRLRVADERQINPATIMPGYYRDPAVFNRVPADFAGQSLLTAQEIEDVVAYLATLR